MMATEPPYPTSGQAGPYVTWEALSRELGALRDSMAQDREEDRRIRAEDRREREVERMETRARFTSIEKKLDRLLGDWQRRAGEEAADGRHVAADAAELEGRRARRWAVKLAAVSASFAAIVATFGRWLAELLFD